MTINMRSLIILLSIIVVTLVNGEENTLKLVQVFFRHGARTPELKDVYPSDPYKLEAFLPMGWGQLTNLGKRQAHTLGTLLRKRYNDFLGDVYYPGMVYAQSTDYDRTKASAELVLAGLFPPLGSQMWNDDVKWMPIPLAYEKDHRDFFLRRPIHYCPVYVKELEDVYQSEDYLAYIRANQATFEYISAKVGKPIRSTSDAMGLYQTLTAEKFLNFTLPEWTNTVYPEKITELAAKQCFFENSKPILRKLNGGRSVQKIVENIMAVKPSNSDGKTQQKIYLYSAHENNVLNILAALGLYDTHFPNYSSAVIIELHYVKDEYAVKILYERHLNQEFEEKKLEDCEVLCPLNKFLEITRPIIPANFTAECGSEVNLD